MPTGLTLVLLVGLAGVHVQASVAMECRDASECRQLALEARSRDDFEAFHDLAWRALQKGGQNNPELMTLVARAQSLSGRPHDALVMLNRLADLKVVTDAASSDDFRRVRELPGWADLEARTTTGSRPADAPKVSASPSPPSAPVSTSPKAARPAAPEKPATPEPARDEPAVGEPGEALRFSTAPFTPAGLAYDAVSNRFIIGDRESRKLSVVGERSHNVTNLASATTAGFREIAALAIDPREGDLWVVSSADGAASIHKLQLISGRVFFAAQSPTNTSARFADVSVTPQSTVMALDDLGRRLFRLRPGSKELDVGWVIEAQEPVSVAALSEAVVYVAHREGIARIDLGSGHERPLRARDGIELTGIRWIRTYRGGLVAVQRMSEGVFRVVRIRLDASGTRATAITLLDKDVAMTAPGAAAITGDTLYYLSADGAGSTSTIVKRVRLR
jgi:hypothetical protein